MLKRQNMWPVVQPMSKLGEFVFVPMKLTVRDSVTQIGNDTSNSGASIQRRTALNVKTTPQKIRFRNVNNYKEFTHR